jgi:AcrR family transcriptional regulator
VSSYHHGNLRATLIEQGVELARAQGPDGVVLRQVARRAGVSHNAAYRHFTDREELLGEIAAIGMQRLAASMLQEMDAVGAQDPAQRARARLRACGRAYVYFALAEPGLFGAAFAATTKVDTAVDTAADPSVDPYALLGLALDDLEEVDALADGRREGAEVLCWSAVHGYAVLHLDGPLRAVPEAERSAGLESLLDQIERGLT